MVCDDGCKKCATTGGDYTVIASPPPNANPGEYVTIPFSVTKNCSLCRDLCIVCLHDENGTCIASTNVLNFANCIPWGCVITAQLSYTQPSDRSFRGSLDVIVIGLLEKYCSDTKPIEVDTNFPPGQQTYSCNNGRCEPAGTTGKYINPDCSGQCTGGGGGGCSPSESNVLGLCVPKPVLLLGGLFLVYSIINR